MSGSRPNGSGVGKAGATLLIVLALQSCQCLAGDSSYYHEFLTATSGKPTPFQITSVSLVDTNNCSPAGRRRLSLSPGAIADARLGMSMDEIVSRWGKPLAAGLSCTGRPTFSYDELWLDFRENQVYSITLYLWKPFTPQFAGGLVPLSGKGKWIRLLGEPSSQHTNTSTVVLCYETNSSVMTLRFDLEDKQLSSVTLARRPQAGSDGKTNDQR